jgi:putative ABC transport system permease protein
MAPEEAAREARKRFVNVQSIREECREVRGARFGEVTWQDLRFAVRSLRKSPGFAAAAVLTLALGTGATTAIFSLVQGLLLHPLPFPDQDSLLLLSESTRWNPSSSVAYPNFIDWRARQHSFSSLGVFRPQDFNVTSGEAPERVNGAMVSHDLFTTLAVQPARGRLFTPAEDAPGAGRTALVRESLWRRRFAGSDTALGGQLSLNGVPYTIIGILPDSTVIPYNSTEVWVPVGLWAKDYQNRRQHPGLRVIGRLKPGVDIESTRADFDTIALQLGNEYPDSNRGAGVKLQRVTDDLFKEIRPAMGVLSAAVACVLMIACANVASLLLVRITTRRREFAVRVALGATRARLLRLLLTESVLLGLGGAAGGFLASFWFVAAIKSLLPASTPRLAQVGVDATVLAFTVGVGIVTGIVFGFLPAWRASRSDIAGELAQSSRGVSLGRQRARALLIVGEFTLTVVLLVSSGLMMRTLHRLYQADLGYATERVMTFSYELPDYAFSDNEARMKAEQQIMPRLAALPGIVSVGYSTALPLTTRANFNGFTVEGTTGIGPSELPMADTANVSPGYFTAMGISLVRGRCFSEADQPNTLRVAIIDAVFAERHFSGQNPIGRRLKIGDAASDLPWMEIVGIVQHIEKYGVDRESGPQLYRPAMQGPGGFAFTFALCTSVEPISLAAGVRQVFREVSPTVPVFDFQTMNDRFAASIWSRRLTAMLLGVFGFLAATLALVGLYGVMSYAVTQRTREMGIRLALGASPRDLLGQVLRQGLLLAGAGIAIGVVVALAVTRLMRSLLYETSPLDPVSFIVVAALSLAIGLLACWFPARCATKIDPMAALRCE